KESKALLEALGIPVVQAIGEGEAQAAFMCRKGDVWAVASQDFDSLLFGTPRLIRNLTITGKRKIPGTKKYVEISPELIDLDLNLSRLGISQKDLIHVALLIGTDFNEGIKGFGPKKAIKAVKEGKITEYFSRNSLEELEKIFLNPPITESYTLCWGTPDKEKVIKLLVEEHEFSLERIEKALESFKKLEDQKLQKRLDRWF
ncbi:MAG: flap structure-specific endonuclease, partial [archaeon]